MVSTTTPQPGAPSSRFARVLTRWGLPAPLFLGYLGLLLFMIGDGIESGFIAPFMADHGAGTDIRASYVITVYGVAVMLASWLSGALSELWGPRRVMMIGLVIWLVFDVLFLAFAVTGENYTLMIITYGIRGFGYPMFAFGFLVWITAVAPVARLGAAVGWFYFAFTGGLPTLGALVASFTNPIFGQYGTLWLSVGLLALGGLVCLLGVRERTGYQRLAPPDVKPVQSLVNSVSIAWKNPRVGIGMVVRIINTAPEFGMLVFFPTIFITQIGFGESRWLLLVSVIYGTNIFFNLIFGVLSDKIGWRTTIFWFGAIGCAISILLLYFVPLSLGADYYWVALLVGALYGATLAGFVPISALLPSLAPENKGGAMALLNLGAGAAAFVGPAIVSLFLGPAGAAGVVIIFAALYVVAAVLTRFLKLPEATRIAAEQNVSLQEVSRKATHS
ncbi:alpha-ketoglutarate transporter [Prauserella marina]|uniref:Polyol permease family n=1 Tax=Prauserella marina TaxID=530584 RepID=A0A222VWN5_9PSEU|nr:MFS transporter [Prauserella marina]ASR38338.1 alpha-ketoglutarate transporter [Prauserella marina]PWV78447.1 polyol permease family [Prauserella marina]SDC86197.1 polyol permease family [Prauserella marina]